MCFVGQTNIAGEHTNMENHIEEIESSSKRDKGFTLVELLIVIVILGILATVTVFAVRGITDKGTTSACNTDKATVQTATESYFAQYGSTTGIASTSATVPAGIPAASNAIVTKPSGVAWNAGANPGATLVAAGLLRSTPTNFFVGNNGVLYVLDIKCAATGGAVGDVAG
jgi:prepilin-type N-terminal cleavage/methylation domain-containing protein